MNFYTYIAYNSKYDKFYIGQTNNSFKRITEHNLGLSNYTSKYDGKWEIAYYEIFDNRSEAMRRERFLKKQKSKKFYRKLCEMNLNKNDSIG
ncbi:MAG: GIY-YIG nuclease family protein [Patescibacteria group bacterium]|nr:GIY-YIG nuclease family protein [Patescibacteria group bacterium]